MTKTVVVVGGGPAGLAAAYRLSQQPDVSVILLERAPGLGGLAAGFRHGDYVLDFGPHRLHTSIDRSVLADLRSFPGMELNLKPRRGLIRLGGGFLPFPIGPASLLGLGVHSAVRLGIGAARAQLSTAKCSTDSFESALCSRLGRPMYDLFYGPYAEKVWGIPGREISADQADRRVNQRGFLDLFRAVLGRGSARQYLYPDGGFGQITAAYASALKSRSNVRTVCDASVDAVQCAEDRITDISWNDGGGKHSIPVENLVWSAPMPEAIRRMALPLPEYVRLAADGLTYRSVVMFYVALRKPEVGSADTYYFPERRFPFNRVIEQKRFSASMVPRDRTVLGMDIACDPDDAIYQASDSKLGELVIPALGQAGLARREDVIEVFSRRLRTAYPIYDRGYGAKLAVVTAWLGRMSNLWLLGRQALFLHNNTHHSLEMGYRAAEAIGAGDRAGWLRTVADLSNRKVED